MDDMEILRVVERIRNPFFTTFFQTFTFLGEEFFVLGLICCLYWCYNKKLAYRICFSYFVSGITIQALKITFKVPRPWILDPTFQAVPSAMKTATGYSFPSGHTQSATALFGTLFYHTKGKTKKFLCILAIFGVACSRMYLGVHTPKDVAVSFMISCILVTLMQHWLSEEVFIRRRITISFLMAGISIAVMIYAFGFLQAGRIEVKYASDCFKAAGAGIGFAIGWYIETTYIRFYEKADSVWLQILKYVIGILGALVIKSGLKMLVSGNMLFDMFRYAVLVLWVTVLFPLIINQYFTNKHKV